MIEVEVVATVQSHRLEPEEKLASIGMTPGPLFRVMAWALLALFAAIPVLVTIAVWQHG
jgi:hypothetical protein